ncbi:unnamed protein product [Colletotrichum noveboracense]|uniref:Carboxylic ester hydrolase n=1 Tax=Colletotrichum noveboracense TaxID=2664923 RepID=A0A9W4RQ10_9PEZI|nr:unnamed protein product [Colletotrichum noveboracense]
MVRRSFVGFAAQAIGAMATLANSHAGFQQYCESFNASTSSTSGVCFASTYIPAGTELQLNEVDATCLAAWRLERSLPRDWRGGLGGFIQYYDVEYGESLGFATIATNNGHQGYTGAPFLHNLDVIQDFAYRSIENGVSIGKQVAQEFYGKSHTKNYYLGCSTGGRQGLKTVQSFPDLFDGVVVGASAIAWNNLTSWATRFYPLLGTTESATFIPLDMWPVIHQGILDRCDTLDGVADGILESPNLCDYLTTPKVFYVLRATAKQAVLDAAGSLVYPKMQLGSEFTGAVDRYFSGAVSPVSDWWRYAIFNDSTWDPMSFGPENYTVASGLDHLNIDTVTPGKVIWERSRAAAGNFFIGTV